MLQALLNSIKHKPPIKQVGSLLFHLSSFPTKLQLQDFHQFPSYSTKTTSYTSQYSSSTIKSGSLSLLVNKGEILHDPIIKDYLFRLCEISPPTIRRFWRVSVLNPHDVLEILLGFENDSGNFEVEVKKIESLWGIYMWVSKENKNFKHLPKASRIIASMLVRAELFKEVECLVSWLDDQGIFLDNHEIYSNLIEVFVSDHRLEKVIAYYDRMRMRGLSPSILCYWVLVEFLIQINETRLAFQIFADALDILAWEGDARDLVKKALAFGIEPNYFVLNSVASGYCDKRDYDDLLSFFVEISCMPDVTIVNKLIHSVCRQFEILVRNLKPHIYSYDAILSGLFKEGMWKHYKDILQEMEDQGVEPQLLTFRVLLSGFCKARQFDEVNNVVSKMVDRGLIQLSPSEDLLSGAFRFLGLDSSAVKIRRDNDIRFHKAKFFDYLGNGLYLDTDVEEYERTVNKVLDDAMLPDFNSSVWNDYMRKDTNKAVMMVDQMTCWGQEISMGALDPVGGKKYLWKVPDLTRRLDQETLNVLVQKHSKKGYVHRAKAVLQGMLGRHLRVDSETHTALLMGLCKKEKQLFSRLCRRKRLNEALELFKALLVLYPNEVSDDFHVFHEELSAEGFTTPAKVLAKEILSQGYILSRSAHSHLIQEFCKWRSFREAVVVCDSMLAKDWVPPLDASLQLIPQLCRSGNFGKAVVLKDICYCQANKRKKVEELLGFVISKKLGISIESYRNIVQLMCTEGKGFCRGKDLSSATQYLKSMTEKDLRPSNRSLRELSRGELGEAVNFLDGMAIKGLIPENIDYNYLIKRLCQHGRVDKSVDLMNIMLRKGNVPESNSFDYVIQSFCTLRKLDVALNFHAEMLCRNQRPSINTWSVLIRSLSEVGQLAEAEKQLDSMVQLGEIPRRETYSLMINKYRSQNNLNKASELLRSMQRCGYEPDFETH
ncbi:hypothetical protein RND71_034132 [Anisodus tanguticus]|uniref:Pentatricopeptide repeat-containing protein n=1 Tax=Anisodus tanguticus TaxID=243964 RepID=A0AAE1RAS5_9SOLA|nr:hypothetical protein RND71_034132 [Anisodus tanguticus]